MSGVWRSVNSSLPYQDVTRKFYHRDGKYFYNILRRQVEKSLMSDARRIFFSHLSNIIKSHLDIMWRKV